MALAGCVTQGTAVGQVENPAGRAEGGVTLAWKSDFADPTGGTIAGRLPDGTAYTGRYFEIVKTATAESLDPAWDTWTAPYWSDGDDFGGPEYNEFVTFYSGKVLATLKSADGKKSLRCQFTLAKPSSGLAGGGVGQCQGSDGKMISDVVLAEAE